MSPQADLLRSLARANKSTRTKSNRSLTSWLYGPSANSCICKSTFQAYEKARRRRKGRTLLRSTAGLSARAKSREILRQISRLNLGLFLIGAAYTSTAFTASVSCGSDVSADAPVKELVCWEFFSSSEESLVQKSSFGFSFLGSRRKDY